MKSHHSRRMAALALANAFFFCTASAARADTFGAASDIPIAPDTATIIAADLNGDGRADIVSGITGRLLTGILISRQDGTFANMPALSASGSLGAGDFDGDNKTDIVCLGRVGDGSTISIFPGNGDGTFGTPTVTPIPGVRWLVQLADFNSDGRPDLLTAPAVYGKLPVAVLLSRPGGLVSQPIEIPGTVDNPVVADFDGDGVSDVIVGVRISQHSFVPGLFAGLGDGTFAEPVSLPSFGVPGASGDFNGDGAIDVAGLKDGGEDGYDTAIVGFAYGDGHGMFHSVIDVTLPALTSVQRSVVDFDGDGRDDLLAIGKDGLAEIRAADVYLVHGADAGEARDVETYGALLPNTVVVGDFNGDRLSDLAVGG